MTQQDTQPPAETLARQELEALANLIERPPHDDVLLKQDVALRSATAIRVVLAALTRRAGGDAIPAGWQLVPVEPTPEMAMAGEIARERPGPAYAEDVWAAMLSATPKPPAGGDAGAVEHLRGELRRIAEGNLGDAPWQANYARIKEIAAAALALPAPVVEGEVERIALAKLFKAAVDHMQDGWDWDGCDLQAACRQAGLIYERPYNAETDAHTDAEEGDTVWVPTDAGTRILDIARAALSEGRSHG